MHPCPVEVNIDEVIFSMISKIVNLLRRYGGKLVIDEEITGGNILIVRKQIMMKRTAI